MPPAAMASRVRVAIRSDRRPSGVVAVGAGVAQGQVHQGGLGELGGPSEPSPLGIEATGQLGGRGLEESASPGGGRPRDVEHRRPGPGRGDRAGADGVRQLVGLRLHFVAAVLPHVGQRGEDGPERRCAAPVGRGEVRPTEERPPVRGQEHAHRPPPRTGDGLDGLHVDGVHVGPFLPVHLDRDESGVQLGGGVGVLERLVGHHVTPVAGRVTDGEEDGPVLPTGPVEGLVAPGVPVDGVVGVLAEVGRGLVGQSVRAHDGQRSDCRLGLPAARDPLRPPGVRSPSAQGGGPACRCHLRRAR